MRYKDRTVTSVAQVLSALKTQSKPNRTIWFRGQGVAEWELVPSLARNAAHLRAENAVLKRFMQNATPLIRMQLKEEWEWMFLMQHHRVPTRLLDWSESVLAALYFAVSEAERFGQDGAVWCLDPIALNKLANVSFPFNPEIPSFGRDKVTQSYLPTHVEEDPSTLSPIAIMGPRNTPRMMAQLGTFTINHRAHTPIETLGKARHVWRWIVPASAKAQLLKELNLIGVNQLSLFPELDNVSQLCKELLP